MKKGFFFLLFLFGLGAPLSANAQNRAPAMFGVGEVVVDFPVFADAEASDRCGLERTPLLEALMTAFKGTSVPAVAAPDAKPPRFDRVRLFLAPRVFSYVDEALGCVSWLDLDAQSEASVVVPPVRVPRSVTIVYWHDGARVMSSRAAHARKVSEMLTALAHGFAQRYQIDQPVPVSR